MALEWVRTRLRPHRRETGIMRKIEREPNGAGIFRPGQDLVVAGTIGKNGVKAALSAKEKELSAKITEAQNRLAEINVLKTHIVN